MLISPIWGQVNSPIQQKYDSLNLVLLQKLDDTTKIQTLLILECLSAQLGKSQVLYAEQAYELAKAIGDSTRMAQAIFEMLTNEANQSSPEKLRKAETQLPFLARQADNTYYIKVLIWIGYAYVHSYNHRKVASFLRKTKEEMERNLSDSLLYAYYLDTKSYWVSRTIAEGQFPHLIKEQTEDLLREALDITTRHGDERDIFLAKYSLAHGLALERKNKPEALSLIRECIGFARKTGETNALRYFYNTLAKWEEEVMPINLDTSLLYYGKSLAIDKVAKVNWKLALSLYHLANVYFKQDKLNAAKENLLKILEDLDHSSISALKINYLTHQLLAQIYEKEENFKLALKTEKIAQLLQDSMQTDEFNQQLAIEQNSFETREQEHQNEILKHQNELLLTKSQYSQYIIWGLILLFLKVIIFYFALRSKNKKIQKQADHLEKINIKKSQFFMNVAHELRTPLTLILGPLGKLAKDHVNTPTLHSELQQIEQNSILLKDLVEEVLDFSKIENQALELNEKNTVLVAFVKTIVQNFEQYAEWHGIKLVEQYPIEKELAIDIDRQKFRKIINNLYANALKFSSKGGTITITLKRVEQYLLIQIADTGIGMSKKDLPRIFDRYYQTNTAQLGGTGIGLALTKAYVELMGGTIFVDSTLGIGSTFKIRLPLKNPKIMEDTSSIFLNPQLNLQKEQKLKSSQITHDTITKDEIATILIVEDNPELAIYLKNIINPFYEIIIVPNGQAALDFLKLSVAKERIDLILTDIMMPIMDGISFLEKLKNDAFWAEVPVIVLSARTDEISRTKTLVLGVDDYLKKPFVEDELLTRIYNLLTFKNQKETSLANQSPIEKTIMPSVDREWMKQVEEIISKNLTQAQFSVVFIAREMTISERQLQRRINQITGMTPQQYIKEIRLQRALIMLENQQFNSVAEVSYAVGINTPKYFSRIFKDRFGKLPSSYLDA